MASETEGFICPYCQVGFASSGKLQSHFVDMHSGQGQVECGNVDGDGDVRTVVKNVAKGAAKPVSSFMQNAGKKPPDPHCNVPLYDKVNPDQPVVVEPLLLRQSAGGNDMWAQFKFPILPDSNKQAKMRSENCPVPELISKTVGGTDPPFTVAFGDPMLKKIHSAYGVSQVNQDQKLQVAKKQPVRPPVAKKPSPHTPAPKPHVHQKLQKAKKQPVYPPLVKKPLPPTPAPKPHVHQKLQKAKKQPVHPLVVKKPSPPTPAPKPHVQQKLQEANSVDPLQIPRRKTKHKEMVVLPGDGLSDTKIISDGDDGWDYMFSDNFVGLEQPLASNKQPVASTDQPPNISRDPIPSDLIGKKNPPRRPPRPVSSDQKKVPSESTVKALMHYWYRPDITRDEAIKFVGQLEECSFIIRDSQTVYGGYALTMKTSEKYERQRRKLAEDHPVTEDMCVTHFLIQPDPEGVKLQGFNERAFKSLSLFIAQHTVEKLCLPCLLVLPKSGVSRRRPDTMREALISGAACDLVSLGSVDVPGPGSEALLAKTVQQMKSLKLSTMNIVTFKASKEGITLNDNVNGMYFKRHYPISSITFCALDPNDTRWDFPHLQHHRDNLKHKPCFGIFYRPQDGHGYSCLLFAEYDSSQPVTSVVSYIQRIMKHYSPPPSEVVAKKNMLPKRSEENKLPSDIESEANFQLKKLLEKYRHQRRIKHKSLKCLFTGPPRVGKTTLKKRLLKTIKNLISSGVVSPSGGLEKPITVVIGETRGRVTVTMESDTDWQPQHNLLDEAQVVLEFIDQQATSHPSGLPTPAAVSPTPVPSTQALPKSISPTPAPSTPAPPKPDPDLPTPGKPEANTLDDAKKLMQEVLSSRKLRNIKDIEKTTTIYIMDIGGQPEFHEIMPIIFNGPALHLIFFNLAFNLNDPIPIQFCRQDGSDSLITYNSSYTGKQMIFQLLSSLYYLSKGLSPDSEPAAVLIATHLDQLMVQGGQGENKIEEIDDSLKELLCNVEFHNQGFLTYPKEHGKSTIFIPVNNYSGDEEEIQQLQAFVRQVVDDRFGSVELPSSWLFFHLLLRHRYENSPGVCTLADCRALAKGCGLDENDVPQVLQYIHRRLGTILFYDEVQGLNELVICDPNVLFDSIYQLVAVSFGGDKAQHTFTAEVRKTGEIPVKVLERIGTQPSSSLITNEHVIGLLKHFGILTELSSADGTAYFMPCLLQPNNSLNLSKKALQSLCPPPLLVRFDGNYIPVGIFSALVVKLSASSWEPDRNSRYRNHVLFHTDGVFPVELIVSPAYLEFRITIASYEEDPKEIHQFCMEVRKTVVNTLKSILSLHEHTKKAKFQLGFYCPGSFHSGGQLHFCGCLPRQNHINPKAFICSKSPRCQDQCRLPHECTIWFDYWKNTKETARCGDQETSSDSVGKTTATQSSSDACDVSGVDSTPLEQCSLKAALDSISTLTAEWFNLGVALRLSSDTLREIEYNHRGDARRCLTEMVIAWLQMKDNSQPSWQSLASALCSPLVNRIEIATMIAAEHPVDN